MKPAVVTDASCLIDLRKGGLLPVLCNLAYRFMVPLPVRQWEVLDFPEWQWRQLDDVGLATYDLTAADVSVALTLQESHPALSAYDCFCMVTALAHPGVLLTGDAQLREVATAAGVRVHGVLWIVDEFDAVDACPRSLLIGALSAWERDTAVFLPRDEVSKRLVRLAES